MVDRSIKFLKLITKIYERASIDRNVCEIEVTHKVVDNKSSKIAPTRIYNNLDIKDFMFLYENEKSVILYVILKENQDQRK